MKHCHSVTFWVCLPPLAESRNKPVIRASVWSLNSPSFFVQKVRKIWGVYPDHRRWKKEPDFYYSAVKTSVAPKIKRKQDDVWSQGGAISLSDACILIKWSWRLGNQSNRSQQVSRLTLSFANDCHHLESLHLQSDHSHRRPTTLQVQVSDTMQSFVGLSWYSGTDFSQHPPVSLRNLLRSCADPLSAQKILDLLSFPRSPESVVCSGWSNSSFNAFSSGSGIINIVSIVVVGVVVIL